MRVERNEICLSDVISRSSHDTLAALKSLRSVQISILEPKNYPRTSKN